MTVGSEGKQAEPLPFSSAFFAWLGLSRPGSEWPEQPPDCSTSDTTQGSAHLPPELTPPWKHPEADRLALGVHPQMAAPELNPSLWEMQGWGCLGPKRELNPLWLGGGRRAMAVHRSVTRGTIQLVEWTEPPLMEEAGMGTGLGAQGQMVGSGHF